MTVVATIITRHFTAHASDSYLTRQKPDGTLEQVDTQSTKLVPVPHWRGAMAFWGLALNGTWSTLSWLRHHAAQAGQHSSAEQFANALAADLSGELERQTFHRPREKGIGIHFTAYERVQDYWIPELFLLSNWTDVSYRDVQKQVGVSRRTYFTVKNVDAGPVGAESGFRIEVHTFLRNGGLLLFNNGDPVLFNPIANAMGNVFRELYGRGAISQSDSKETHCALVRHPVEAVSRLIAVLCIPTVRRIGGKPHDLCISPEGIFWSSTGDV